MYAVCRALSLIDIKVNPAQLWNANNISDRVGSPAELKATIESFDAKAQIMTNVSALEICAMSSPFIANVRARADSVSYDHWYVYNQAEADLCFMMVSILVKR